MKLKKKKIKDKRIGLFIIVALVILFLLLLAAFKDTGTDKEAIYGDRLDAIKDVPVTKGNLSSINKAVSDTGKVKSVTSRVQGRIIIVNIIINKETSREDAKALSDTVLSKISDKQKELYDVEIFVDKEEDATFPIIGYRHKGKDKAVSWTVDR